MELQRKVHIKVDLTKKPHDQPFPIHNRWHPEIPPVAEVDLNELFRVECLDYTGGQIGDNDSADDLKNMDYFLPHCLSGPIKVNGAEPGDILVVDLLDIGALPGSEWGFTGICAKENGGGFLCNEYPNPAKAIWHFEGKIATSRHIPHVRLTSLIHPGLIGCAPSAEEVARWSKREAELVAKDPNRVPSFAKLPTSKSALVGALKGDLAEKVKNEALRTLPPREHGGNCDIKNLSIGSRLYLPVSVPGANLSMGDIHFSQGDGEITLCGAIEMAGWLDLKVDLIKGGIAKYNMKNPMFLPGSMNPTYSQYLYFQGISVTDKGEQLYLDATCAYKNACLNAVEYLKLHGFTGEQAYLFLGAAPVEGRVSSIVDMPNACCTVAIPTEIFDIDIKPH